MVDEVITISEVPAHLALVASRRVAMADVATAMGELFETLMRHVGATQARIVGPPFSMYPEPPEGEFTVVVGVPVEAGAVGGGGVTVQDMPATQAATLLYRGPYDAMEPAWRRLMEWVETSGRQPGGPPREIYLNDPEQVAPEDLLTQLIVPLA